MIAVSDAKLSAALSLIAAGVIVVASFWPWHAQGYDVPLPKAWPKWVFGLALLLLLGSAYFLGMSR